MNISFDQNTIIIADYIYEACKKDNGFCNGCQLGCVLLDCCDIPCKSPDRKDQQNVIFKKKSDNNN